MEEESTGRLVAKLIAKAVDRYGGNKVLAAKLAGWGYKSVGPGAVSAWKGDGGGITADRLLALARDLEIDMNALLYRGEIACYDRKAADLAAARRKAEEAEALAKEAQALIRRMLGEDANSGA